MRHDRTRSIDAFAATTVVRTMGPLRAFACRFEPHSVLPMHAHDAASVFIVLRGMLSERVGGRAHECVPGTVMLKAAHFEHSDVVGPAPLEVVGLEFTDGNSYRDGIAVRNDTLWHARNGVVLALGSRIRTELAAQDAAADLIVESIALDLLAMQFRSDDRGERRAPRWLEQLVSRIHDAAAHDLPSLSSVAQETGLNAVYVARAFRRHTGCSIGAYVRRVRLDRAAVRLARTTEPIALIALDSCFADQSHFTRAFREQFGCTPRAFRMARRAE